MQITAAERHDREKHWILSMSEPERARHHVGARELYARDSWAFLRDCVYTINQVSDNEAIQPFPSDLEYLMFLNDAWKCQRLLACPKSRRMFCSWNFISLFLHDTIFRNGRFNAFVSKKEDDAGELVARAEFIYQHIPEWRIPKALLPAVKNGKMSLQPPLLVFPDINSKIQGFPQGADQLRQFTLSGIFGDECAFWESAQKFYAASTPTLEGGGRMVLVSSRSPGFFKKIVFDQLNAPDLNFREEPPVKPSRPLPGIEMWRNPRNRFCVIDLHYTANPAKRGVEWREAVKASMPMRDFLMEYEKSWQTYEGRPVYEDFNKTIHTSAEPLRAEPGVPFLLGWDFGLTPSCILAQLVGPQLRIYKEFIEGNGSISKLAPIVWQYLSTHYPAAISKSDSLFSFIDPAGFQRAQTDERTCADILRKSGFKNVNPGPIDWEARKSGVEGYLTKLVGRQPAFIVDDTACPILIAGFNGGYRYPDKANDIEPSHLRPLKDQYSHPHDALQYLCAGANAKRSQYNFTIKEPSYSFQGANPNG